jgi:hypothetical protein
MNMSNKIIHIPANKIRNYQIRCDCEAPWFTSMFNAYGTTITVTGTVEQVNIQIAHLKKAGVSISHVLSKPDVTWRDDSQKFGIKRNSHKDKGAKKGHMV